MSAPLIHQQDEQPPELNRRLTQLLLEAGERMGFDVQAEYPVPGGRIDVVWSWIPLSPVPHYEGSIPVVGFEVESSWRTRKHVKGDLLNLQDCGVSLGIIVLAGASKKDESLRRFATALVDRPGAKILVWTEEDVYALAVAQPAMESPFPLDEEEPELHYEPPGHVKEHAGKYRPLWKWLKEQERRPITVSFSDIERILGMPLPDSSRNHVAHSHSRHGSAVARAIIDAGWRASRVQLHAGTVTFLPVGAG